jgi:hypothetical protein
MTEKPELLPGLRTNPSVLMNGGELAYLAGPCVRAIRTNALRGAGPN